MSFFNLIVGLRNLPFTFLLLSSSFLSCFPVAAHGFLTVEWRVGRLSVKAEQVPLSQILQEISQQARVEIRGGEGLQEQVSVCFADLSLQEGFQKLALNYVLVWDAHSHSDQHPRLAVVSGKTGVVPARGCVNSVIPVQAKETRREPAAPMTQQEDHMAAKRVLREAASSLLSGKDKEAALVALMAGTKSERAATRIAALRALSQSDHVEEDVSMSALQTALTDEDEEVRGYAELILQERATLSGE